MQDRKTRLEAEIKALRDSFTVDLPDRPMPNVTPPDESAFLFDNSRDAVTGRRDFGAAGVLSR